MMKGLKGFSWIGQTDEKRVYVYLMLSYYLFATQETSSQAQETQRQEASA